MEAISNRIWIFVSWFNNFYNIIRLLYNWFIDLLSNILSVFSALWFGMKSLLSWLSWLINDVFNGTLWNYLYNWFEQLAWFIWLPWALFISSFLFVAMVRIWISFVFKMFRLNTDYKTMKNTKW